MISSSPSGIARSTSRGRGTCAFLMALIACLPFKLPNSARAQVSSHSTIPVEKMSLRGSTGSPAACSGDMYANLPLMTPFFLAHVARARDAEVDDLHHAVPRDQDVLRRDVAVHDAERLAVLVGLAVRVVERLGHLLPEIGAQPERDARVAPRRRR